MQHTFIFCFKFSVEILLIVEIVIFKDKNVPKTLTIICKTFFHKIHKKLHIKGFMEKNF